MEMLDWIDTKETEVKKFNLGDKIGYALGDLGNSAFFNLISSYLMLFYTDVLGVSAAAVGTLFIIARVWDAINDPIMGMLVDKKGHTKHGKFRPYIILFGVPLTLVGILTFTYIPGIPEALKLPYAYVTYIAFGMLYTAVNIPYGSMASVMTTDPSERTSLSTFRTVGSMIAMILVMFLVPKLIFTNKVPTASGFLKCAILFALICNVCYILTFRLTRERIIHKANDKTKESIGLLKTLKHLSKNRAFVGVSLASFTMMAGQLTGSALNAYLFKDYFKAPELIAISGLAGLVPMLFVIPLVGLFVKKFGKKETAVGGVMISVVAYGALFLMPITNPYVYIGITAVAGLGMGLLNTVIWALVSDAIDYQEYLTGDRNEGTIYSTYSLCRKLSQAISGGVGGFALSILGYKSGIAEQTAEIGLGIKNLVCGANFITAILTLLSMIFIYNLSKSKLVNINAELEKRRA